jgi:hypothetical protein
MAVVSLGGFGACGPGSGPLGDITATIDKVNGTLTQAVQTLGNQSAAWQQTLKDLEAQLASDVSGVESQIVNDVQNLIAQVDTVVKDGVQFAQETFNCQFDIFGSHALIALKNLQIDFLNKVKYEGNSNRPRIAHAPIVCSANPNGINIATWNQSTFMVLSGTDLSLLDTSAPSVVVVRSNGTEAAIANMGNRVTNYRFEVNVPSMINLRLLTDAVQLQIRWNGQRVNRNEIPVVACGMMGGPCCGGGTCSQGSCINSVCSSCGRLGEACCPASTACLGNGTGCAAGRCTTCPAVPQPQQAYRTNGQGVGPSCWPAPAQDSTFTYGGACHSGFHHDQCSPSVSTTCDACTVQASWANPGNPSDCTCKVRFTSPQDCFKAIRADIVVTEIQNTGPRPIGCP